MILKKIKELLDCKNHTNDELLNRDIKYIYAADMMSDVLKSCKISSLLVTGLVNIQVVQVAEILDLNGIIFINGKEPGNDVIEKANSIKIPLLSTVKNFFETCGILYSSGLKCEISNNKQENGSRDSIHTKISD
jgi:predicted transcriptional regulator